MTAFSKKIVVKNLEFSRIFFNIIEIFIQESPYQYRLGRVVTKGVEGVQ